MHLAAMKIFLRGLIFLNHWDIPKIGFKQALIGFNYRCSSFNKRNNYLSYTFRAEGYLRNKNVEDINLLGQC